MTSIEPPDAAFAEFGDQLGIARRYADLLGTTGIEHGLIGPREAARLWDRHILNCSVVGEVIPPGSHVADIGTGAGLPGLVLAIRRPDLRVDLIEPLARRITWLTTTVSALQLTNVTLHHGRAEAFAKRTHVDVVTARAVAPLDRLSTWAAPLLRPGGHLVALKGSSAGDEVASHRATMRRMGLVDVEVRHCGEGVIDPPTIVVRARKGA